MHKTSLQALKKAAGARNLETSPAILSLYGGDASKRQQMPAAVVRAVNTQQVADVLACCHSYGLAVTPRGAGSGLTGGAVASPGGIVLDMSAMRKIELVTKHRLLKAEAGALVDEVKRAAAEAGLYFPPDPSSAAFATIGGSVAENAGGLRAVKYGVTADYVLGLTAVLMDGRILRLGGQTTKSVVGYNLTQLMVGSEGTLAVITQATLKLVPPPEAVFTLSACFSSSEEALALVERLNAQTIVPTALEFMDARTLEAVRLQGGFNLPEDARAMLLLEIDGAPEVVARQGRQMEEAAGAAGGFALQSARNQEEAANVWQVRRGMSQAMFRLGSHKRNQDIALPLGSLSRILPLLKRIEEDTGTSIATFGHAGDGNLHVNVMYQGQDPAQTEKARQAVSQLFAHTLHLGGSVSGEHGVGLTKLPGARMQLDEVALELMWEIKKSFDPSGLLNPGKALPPLKLNQ